jgi:anti-sigma-K factor RskA
MAEPPTERNEELIALAGEYALGVLNPEERRAFERLAGQDPEARVELEAWQKRLGSLDAEYADITPPVAIKSNIDSRLFPVPKDAAKTSVAGGLRNALGFWRGLGIVASIAFVALGLYNTQMVASLDSVREDLASARQELDQSKEILAALETRLGEAEISADLSQQELASAQELLARTQTELEESQSREKPVLVVSLESGETDYRFLAVHEEGSERIRMTLVSGGAAESDKDFELWLVEPEKDTVSLGVIDAGKTAIELNRDQVNALEAGGLLAVSLEQRGGSPTGMAQGPILAAGEPRRF